MLESFKSGIPTPQSPAMIRITFKRFDGDTKNSKVLHVIYHQNYVATELQKEKFTPLNSEGTPLMPPLVTSQN